MNKVILGIFIFQFIAPVLICADEITSVSQKSFINEENILFWDCRNQNLQKEKEMPVPDLMVRLGMVNTMN